MAFSGHCPVSSWCACSRDSLPLLCSFVEGFALVTFVTDINADGRTGFYDSCEG